MYTYVYCILSSPKAATFNGDVSCEWSVPMPCITHKAPTCYRLKMACILKETSPKNDRTSFQNNDLSGIHGQDNSHGFLLMRQKERILAFNLLTMDNHTSKKKINY